MKGQDISSQVFGKYQFGFTFAGFNWSDEDEAHTGLLGAIPKWGSLSAPGPVRVRYVPGFRLWQKLGLIPCGKQGQRT